MVPFARFAAVTLCAASLCACTSRATKREPSQASRQHVAEPPKLEPASIERAALKVPDQLDWLLFGGGSEPLSNQISLAQDLQLMRDMLDGRGLTLFASGSRAMLALDMEPAPRHTPELYEELARMFGVPGGERTRYEPAKLPIDGPSTVEQVLGVLERALEQGSGPLFVYAASHGDRGERPSDNALSLWGGWPLKVGDIANLLDRHAEHGRPTRWVITACYGGGFADLAFKGGDPGSGARGPEHCGLFAAPWDDEASGCDPNPDRRAQESYSIYFLHALEGQDRRGQPRLRDIDIDGDKRVSLLEAHTYARIASRSFDAPTTTSERFLRENTQADERQALDPLASPEDVAVVRALGEELELDDEAAARAKLSELDQIMEQANTALDNAQRQADDAYYALRIALLERWPLLDHPWEARTQRLVRREGRQIMRLLTDSELATSQRQSLSELDQALSDQNAVRVERARVLRLVRAFETLRLASALRRKGGTRYAHYEALQSCERWVPPLRSPMARAVPLR